MSVRWITAATATLVALIAAAWIWRSRQAPQILLVDRAAEAELLLLERQLEPRGLPSIALAAEADRPLAREPVDEALAKQLYNFRDFLVYDEHAYFRYASNLDTPVPLPGYPGGGFRRRTNSAGEREDHETFTSPLDLFVLVAGDSHTDGLCQNRESYPNLLEDRLRRTRPGRAVEVLNTGVQGYSFYNYLGVLEKYANRKPAVFVTGIYGGNDFLETLRVHHLFRHTVPPPRSQKYWDELQKLQRVGPAAVAQGVDAILYFEHHPDQVEVALESALQVGAEIDRQCRATGIPWIVLYIPSAFEADFAEARPLRAEVERALGFGEFDMRVLDRLADRTLERYRERGVEVLDLREVFAAEKGPWYGSDLHIVPRAHERIAELLEPRVEAALAAR